jgi:hypothetical protein
MDKDATIEFLEGIRKFAGKGDEVFFTAADDIKHIKTPEGMAERLTLRQYADRPELRTDADTVIVFKRAKPDGISTPIDPKGDRGWGFKGNGKTEGGAREWVMENGSIQDMRAKGFEIDHIYTLDAKGGKKTWEIVADQKGKYTEKSSSALKQKENITNLSNSSKGIKSQENPMSGSTNAPTAANTGSSMKKPLAMANAISTENSPLPKPSNASQNSKISSNQGAKAVEKELVKTSIITLAVGSLMAATAKTVASAMSGSASPQTSNQAVTSLSPSPLAGEGALRGSNLAALNQNTTVAQTSNQAVTAHNPSPLGGEGRVRGNNLTALNQNTAVAQTSNQAVNFLSPSPLALTMSHNFYWTKLG